MEGLEAEVISSWDWDIPISLAVVETDKLTANDLKTIVRLLGEKGNLKPISSHDKFQQRTRERSYFKAQLLTIKC